MNAPIRSAAAIIRDRQGRVLVRKRATSAFMQPGGKIDANALPRAAPARGLRGARLSRPAERASWASSPRRRPMRPAKTLPICSPSRSPAI